MAMSRMALRPLLLIAAAAPAAAPAQLPEPEEAIARQQSEVRDLVGQACAGPPASGDPNDVVVCGRRDPVSRYRVAPSELLPGSSSRETAGGEQLRAMAANGGGPCTNIGPNPRCGGGLDFIAIGFTAIRLIGQALANRD